MFLLNEGLSVTAAPPDAFVILREESVASLEIGAASDFEYEQALEEAEKAALSITG